jgi:Arc/MetJ family transcription regulator
MPTTIEIDSEMMQRALLTSGLPSRQAAVEAGLRLLLRLYEQTEIRDRAGQFHWTGDLDASRCGHIAAAPETVESNGGK